MARLPILMYHTICNHSSNSKGLTLSYDKLEAQFKYLVAQGYTSLHFRDIEKFKHTNDFPAIQNTTHRACFKNRYVGVSQSHIN